MTVDPDIRDGVLDEEGIRQFEEERKLREWWNAHWDELLARYPEEFVAMRGGEIVAHDPDFWDLVATLKEMGLKHYETRTQYVSRSLASMNLTLVEYGFDPRVL